MTGADSVPASEVERLIEEYTEVYNEHKHSESDYCRGMAEGARCSANDLKRLLEREAESDE